MENPKRARSWKRPLRPRANLKNDVPVLYSTYSTPLQYTGSLTEIAAHLGVQYATSAFMCVKVEKVIAQNVIRLASKPLG
jgi:hypothetical protein